MNKRNSIYTQLLWLLIGSAVVVSIAFVGVDALGELCIEKYIANSNYVKNENQRYTEELQKIINKEQLSSKDVAKINTWIKKQKILSIQVYKDDIQIFDSEYPDQDMLDEEITAGNYSWEKYYPIQFTDGEAEIVIMGAYGYQLYSYFWIAEICFSFVLFLTLVLFGIRKKMKYILKLSNEIEILEGGSLDCPITIEGKDELSVLAEGLDSMRLSFQNLINQETEMIQENQRIVTEMSHDLRTPVTSIMLYTEILKMGKYENDAQLKEYIEKIDQKAHRMKQLTDHLFEYSLIAGEDEIELEEPELYEVLFYDLFSETANYLNQRGFEVKFHVEWIGCEICISTDYIIRIMDNITSNIVKYADSKCPVIISSVIKKRTVGFVFENQIRLLEETVESTGIGIQNIKNMMQKMNGECIVEKTEEKFRIMILLPIIKKNTDEEKVCS